MWIWKRRLIVGSTGLPRSQGRDELIYHIGLTLCEEIVVGCEQVVQDGLWYPLLKFEILLLRST